MSIQYNLTANNGQFTEPVRVIPNVQITTTNGYVQYAIGTLADYKNNSVTWLNWPLGSSSGTGTTIRSMIVRLVATLDNATLIADQGSRDAEQNRIIPADAYWLVGNSLYGLAGIIGGSLSSLPKTLRAAISGVGDSIMAYGDGTGSGSANTGPTSQSIIEWSLALSGQPAPQIINRGVGGKTIDLVITEQLNSAMSDDTDVIWIHAGINNLNPSIDPSAPTVAQIIAKMDYLVKIASSKYIVIIDAITPLASNSISGALPRVADIPLVNTGFALIAAKYENVFYNDVYTPIATSSTSGLAIANATVPADGIHLSTLGAYLCGLASINTLTNAVLFRSKYRTNTTYRLPEITGNTGTKVPNSGTINGDVATGYTLVIDTAVSANVILNASVSNGKQRVEIVNGNASRCRVRFQLTSSTAFLSGLANGDLVMFGGNIDVINPSGLASHDVVFTQNPGGTPVNFSTLQRSNQEPTPIFPTSSYSASLRSIALLTATPTSTQTLFAIEVAGSSTATVDLSTNLQEKVVAF